ncbi:sulfatase [Nocardioides sp. SR21]|uniref:sulfatase family protein n=1 Tax=Nocardioides sp. SR21 TaxID=2919501 RepID=UPI001FAA3508|nr:sulfatase [Nocardioides sp. SR21]
MTRSRVSFWTAAAVLAVGLAVPPAGPATSGVPTTAAAAGRPNIVLITTDDQSTSDLRWMPQTRHLLGDSGVRFSNFISPNPLCCPARASILTGQYSQNNHVRDNSGPFGGYGALDNTRTVATWLHDSGYHTGFIGKYLNLYRGDPPTQPGWDVFNAIVAGIYRYFDFQMTGRGAPVTVEGVHSNDTIAALTRELIEEFSTDSSPFFIWASYVAPHGTCRTATEGGGCTHRPRPAVRHETILADEIAPQLSKPSFNEDVSDKPGMLSSRPEVDPADVQAIFTERIRSLASVDDAVADTVAALEEAGEIDDTVVVFTSDNGYLLGEHRHIGKVVPYQESVSIPLLIRGPGIPAGQVRRQATSLIDLAPTFAALAGADPDLVVDGRDLMPFATENRELRRATQLIQTARHGHAVTYVGVRTGRYTYVRWRSGFIELYDRRLDPGELHNRAGTARYRPVEAALAGRLRALRNCSGPECRTPFPVLPAPRTPPGA